MSGIVVGAGVVVALVAAGCGFYNASSPVAPDLSQVQRDCAATHPLVGKTSTLSSVYHGVSGRVTVVDDCTLALEGFSYDGGGVDVRVIAASDDGDGDFKRGTILTRDMRRSTPYENETVTVPLPEGVTLDDVGAVAVWCLPFGVSFGDAALVAN